MYAIKGVWRDQLETVCTDILSHDFVFRICRQLEFANLNSGPVDFSKPMETTLHSAVSVAHQPHFI